MYIYVISKYVFESRSDQPLACPLIKSAESDCSSFFKMPAALVENSQVICEVWASNLEEEMRKIREIVLSYSYIAMVKSSTLFNSPSAADLGNTQCEILKERLPPKPW